MKLTIELVPKTAWYSNVRALMSSDEWDVIRKDSYAKANGKCEICGETGRSQGFSHDLECHEIWKYDMSSHIQTLTGFISLCPLCHKAKHIGLTGLGPKDVYHKVIRHIMKVNKMTGPEVSDFIDEAFLEWKRKNEINWETDITFAKIKKS
jgi:5-methylcytosine-specific restriction endonuclease McrA